jgi:hypothetical protein
MDNNDDLVKVRGDFVTRSNTCHNSNLTAGTLEIGGDFIQETASITNFKPTGTHTVVLNGTKLQTVSFTNPGEDNSRFNNLKITNTSPGGVVLASDVYITGGLKNTNSKITNGYRLILAATGFLTDNVWNHDLRFNSSRTLTADTEIGGTLYIQCDKNNDVINLNGKTLIVNNDLILSKDVSYQLMR